MKRIAFCLLIGTLSFTAWSQFPSNKLDIDLGVQYLQPMGATTQEFGYTLFPNYNSGTGAFIAGKYEFRKNWLASMRMGSAEFSMHAFEQDLLIENPSSSIFQFSLMGGYKTDLSGWLSVPIELQALAEFGLATHTLQVEGFRVFADRPLDIGNEFQESDFTAGITIHLAYQLNLNFKCFVATGYQFINADHVLYRDDSFRFFNLRTGITMRLMHNKFYRFER